MATFRQKLSWFFGGLASSFDPASSYDFPTDITARSHARQADDEDDDDTSATGVSGGTAMLITAIVASFALMIGAVTHLLIPRSQGMFETWSLVRIGIVLMLAYFVHRTWKYLNRYRHAPSSSRRGRSWKPLALFLGFVAIWLALTFMTEGSVGGLWIPLVIMIGIMALVAWYIVRLSATVDTQSDAARRDPQGPTAGATGRPATENKSRFRKLFGDKAVDDLVKHFIIGILILLVFGFFFYLFMPAEWKALFSVWTVGILAVTLILAILIGYFKVPMAKVAVWILGVSAFLFILYYQLNHQPFKQAVGSLFTGGSTRAEYRAALERASGGLPPIVARPIQAPPSEIAEALKRSGFGRSEETLRIATAIAQAESSYRHYTDGDPKKGVFVHPQNPNGTCDMGLMGANTAKFYSFGKEHAAASRDEWFHVLKDEKRTDLQDFCTDKTGITGVAVGKAVDLGYDPRDLDQHLSYAYALYQKEGWRPWRASAHNWRNAIPMVDGQPVPDVATVIAPVGTWSESYRPSSNTCKYFDEPAEIGQWRAKLPNGEWTPPMQFSEGYEGTTLELQFMSLAGKPIPIEVLTINQPAEGCGDWWKYWAEKK